MRKLWNERTLWSFLGAFLGAGLATGSLKAELRPDKIHVADSKKSQSYIRDGLITGGDKAIDEVVVKDIRRATNAGYERVVIDLEGTYAGQSAAIARPPYYQVSVTPDEKRMVFTIWGKPRLDFDSKRVVGTFKRSSVIDNIELLPRVDDTTWSFVAALKGNTPVEVFELSNPVRIILDFKGSAKPEPKAAPATKAHAKSHAKPAKSKKAAHPTQVVPNEMDPVPAIDGEQAPEHSEEHKG